MVRNAQMQFPVKQGNLCFTFLPSGDIHKIMDGQVLINQLQGNPLDGSMNNIYLRIYDEGTINWYPLLGTASGSAMSKHEKGVIFSGESGGVAYNVNFHLTDQAIWFWEVILRADGVTADLIYGQDLGLADLSAVRSNEAYMSQYMDHQAFEDDTRGYVVCTRQNQPQKRGFPYLQQGALGKTVGYSTDGYQFFGLSYKKTNMPEILTEQTLKNKVYQYEFAYTALQSEKLHINGEKQFVFYGLFKENHENAVTELEYDEQVHQAWATIKSVQQNEQVNDVHAASGIGKPFSALQMTAEEVAERFPNRRLEETVEGKLMSFFTPEHAHVVMQQKEMQVERPHGHILMSGHNDVIKDTTLTSNMYMYGVFNAQISIGNTNMNKMISNTRNPLNILKTSGQRIYVEIEGVYRLLTMPSAFEMGVNYARWFYKTETDVITITNFAALETPDIQLEATSEKGRNYRFIITNQVTMQNNEYEVPFQLTEIGDELIFQATDEADSKGVYPGLAYRMLISGTEFSVKDESFMANNALAGSASLVVVELKEASSWNIHIQGSIENKEHFPIAELDFETERQRFRTFYQDVMKNFRLSINGEQFVKEIEKVNTLAWWYTHNMLVHFSVPHGLEQYGGAAWGTRDVSQGPAEYFMATQNYETVRDIIKTLFSHQYEDEGNWPQWFMFDRYSQIQQEDSHGDVVVWPLKLIGDYIEATNDFSILQEEVPFTNRQNYCFTEKKASLLDHVQKEIDYIKSHFLHSTHLSSYGDGDWDDTLQPANQNLKEYMVSSWTVALTYEALRKIAKAIMKTDGPQADKVQALADGVKRDFNHYLLKTDVVPGFVYMEDLESIEPMIHPDDQKTGIQYRLLPMQQGIISELFTKEQARHHHLLIKEHLSFPDGVHLMNRPADYQGGASRNFKRAEQAANFGREVGLQYVHAHIRYVEAVAKLGLTDEAWDGLAVINPIAIQDAVPNAEIRQSNAYFSSSDGKFDTRYEAQENFEQLKDGAVQVKGGWRIYSSGPGIYMNQLISNTLGIRQHQGDMVIDPVLPERLDGLQFHYSWNGFPVTFTYRLKTNKREIVFNGRKVQTEELENQYRTGGLIVSRIQLDALLEKTDNHIEVHL
ncbi:cellobiose phosphorylase [Planococcus sp. CP5-4]|uniref:GH36-type glycosyl hydrolase domain-containing protein n=1 Tax=unclassified Planococcus (in: firmicutes) TaxID=2662419 RepID=UPI001C214F4A|nr:MULTISPECIES: cellobiose phosphorylase [unclassified Planococcus (in: firmicutes)]MBU9672698.1 cellobiose phosphorylase [Planococcus sp. CP5-4_YE]MBV0908472.1 cellobiose phosphorylase [Planococcus sp. CP5-4_UN]MBW6063239.1 cellobiose phosphorylase [Planococcus sp. CP5-4]